MGRFLAILVLCCVNATSIVLAQDNSYDDPVYIDSLTLLTDSLSEETDENSDADLLIYSARADSTPVELREFDAQRFEELPADPDLDYKVPPTVAESLWDRFWAWVAELIADLFSRTVFTSGGRLLLYLGGLAILVVLILMLLKVDAFRMLYAGKSARVKHLVLDEDIEGMDFDKLLQEAIRKNEYRKGVRLLFLYALKVLADKHHIRLESGKTNHDYVEEVKVAELRSGFEDLNMFFEYAWYGNFGVTAETFRKAEGIFLSWREKVR